MLENRTNTSPPQGNKCLDGALPTPAAGLGAWHTAPCSHRALGASKEGGERWEQEGLPRGSGIGQGWRGPP